MSKFKGVCFSRLERGTDRLLGGIEVCTLPDNKHPSLLLLGSENIHNLVGRFYSDEDAEAFIAELTALMHTPLVAP